MITAKIVADSINPNGDRLTTMSITFPRFILAELNTHRVFSKNSASSRAIPAKKMIESVKTNPFIPIAWQKEHSGMQGNEYFNGDTAELEDFWLQARDEAVRYASNYNFLGVTKQMSNRLLESFMWHTVLISGTDWDNFFELRCPQYSLNSNVFKSWKDLTASVVDLPTTHKMCGEADVIEKLKHNKGQAEIHMMALAEAMWDARNESIPNQLNWGDWHVPFQTKILQGGHLFPYGIHLAAVKISTAMCARTSYTIVGDEKEFDYKKQIELHDRMANQVPFHASPFEHCAMAEFGRCRNFNGFTQYRHLLETKQI